MIFRQFFDSRSSTYTYLLASRHGGEALCIDPVLERIDRYFQLLKELDLRLVKAIDTHLHADHITGLEARAERTRYHGDGGADQGRCGLHQDQRR
jgi:glyoxylase-like metal-dependent hydrolase (beta-lactamase superfamily II)